MSLGYRIWRCLRDPTFVTVAASEGQKDGQTVTYDDNIILVLSFITLMSVKSVFHDLFICN